MFVFDSKSYPADLQVTKTDDFSLLSLLALLLLLFLFLLDDSAGHTETIVLLVVFVLMDVPSNEQLRV